MSDLFDSLADSTRRDIIGLLREGGPGNREMSVTELVEALGMTQPTVSKHLKVLREAGLVVVREEGQHRYYRLDEAPLRSLSAWAGGAPEHRATPGEPFADLTAVGRAAGGLARDVVVFVEDLRTKLFR